MKNLFILGSTGVIGTRTLEVIRHLGDRFRVIGLAAGSNLRLLTEQCHDYSPRYVYARDTMALHSAALPTDLKLLDTPAQLCEAVASPDVDMVLCAISGTAGLQPVLTAIQAGKDIALASKELLVMAGELVTRTAHEYGVQLLPVDSEHCAIRQCLDGNLQSPLRRIILTCSGGPFHAHPELNLDKVTVAQTLQHPTWTMGQKLTIDCATLMNKGLEMIEAKWLFGVDCSQLDVVIHPQSIVHSMVEFTDGGILAQLGTPDMRLPIQYCLTYPERMPSLASPLDFSQMLSLTFLPPDEQRFPALRLARQALRLGGAAGAIYNAANEIAVEAFLQQKLTFIGISRLVSAALETFGNCPYQSLEELLDIDFRVRETSRCLLSGL